MSLPADDPPHAPELTLRSRVPASADGQALLDFLCARFRYHDRAAWTDAVAAGRVEVDGRRAAVGQRLRTGAQLAYRKLHREPAVDDRIAIVHDDPHVLAVDKPAHLPVHADGPFVRNTLVAILRRRLADAQLFPAHRLDRETSGVLLLARTAVARQHLQAQFAAGTVAKTYVAVVRGHVAADFVVDLPIGHAPDSRIALRRRAGADAVRARPAHTRCEVLARGARHTLLRCVPTTGRTHQIRVHLEAVGHPVLGDKLYGRPDDDFLRFVAAWKGGGDARDVPAGEPERQLLHATELRCAHPHDGAALSVTAPMPATFAAWLD